MNYPLQSKVGHFAGAYLLAGGQSRRMGRDKALLPLHGRPILVHLMDLLENCCPSAAVLAPAGRYESFGFRCVPDLRVECGPLAAVEAALTDTKNDWNLLVACDLPGLTVSWLDTLLQTASRTTFERSCVASGTSQEAVNPLCAVWHKRALPLVSQALNDGKLRVRALMEPLNAAIVIAPDLKILANWNYPEDWIAPKGEEKTNLGS